MRRLLSLALLCCSCRYGWFLLPCAGPPPKVIAQAPPPPDTNPWPDSGYSTVEDITDWCRAGHLENVEERQILCGPKTTEQLDAGRAP